MRSLFSNVKNVFAGKIAAYVYSSTDSLVISAFISTVQVGYLVNYTTISQQLKTLIAGLLNPITPMIGNVLATDSEGESKEGAFKLYAVMRVLIATMIVVPFCVLINDFIAMWVGAEYILPASVVVLLVMDLYIHFVHSVNVDFINAAGSRIEHYIIDTGRQNHRTGRRIAGNGREPDVVLVREKLRRVQIVLAGGQRGLSEVLAQKYR